MSLTNNDRPIYLKEDEVKVEGRDKKSVTLIIIKKGKKVRKVKVAP